MANEPKKPNKPPPQMAQHDRGHATKPQIDRPKMTLGKVLDAMSDAELKALAAKAQKAQKAAR